MTPPTSTQARPRPLPWRGADPAPVLGIDPDASRVAVAVLKPNRRPITRTIRRTDYRGRFCADYDAFLDSLLAWAVVKGAAVFLEDIWLGRNPTTYKALAQVQGELLAAARRHNVAVELVPPSAWQHAVLGFARGRDALKKASHTKALEICGSSDVPATARHRRRAARPCTASRCAVLVCN